MTVYFPPEPKLEFAFEVKLQFHRLPGIETIPIGGGRGFVCLDGGTFQGPGIKGTAVPNTGGDYAHFRTDGVTSFEARYTPSLFPCPLYNPYACHRMSLSSSLPPPYVA